MTLSYLGTELQATVNLINRNFYSGKNPRTEEKEKRRPWIALFIIGSLFLCNLIFHPHIMNLFFSLGIIYASLVIPSLLIIFAKSKVNSFIPTSVILGIVSGFAVQFYWGNIEGIACSIVLTGVAGALTLGVRVIKRY